MRHVLNSLLSSRPLSMLAADSWGPLRHRPAVPHVSWASPQSSWPSIPNPHPPACSKGRVTVLASSAPLAVHRCHGVLGSRAAQHHRRWAPYILSPGTGATSPSTPLDHRGCSSIRSSSVSSRCTGGLVPNSNAPASDTPATSTTPAPITTLSELQAALEHARSLCRQGQQQQVTIDLRGQTVSEGPSRQGLGDRGLLVWGPGVHIRLVNGTLLIPEPEGIKVREGATLELCDMTIFACKQEEGNGVAGLYILTAYDEGTQLVVQGCTVGWLPKPLAPPPYHQRKTSASAGVYVTDGAHATLQGCWFEDLSAGVQACDPGSRVTVRSCIAQRCHTAGFAAHKGATLEAHRSIAMHCANSGFLASGEGTVLDAVDCRSEGNDHAGFQAADGALLRADGECVSASNSHFGFYAQAGASLDLGQACVARANRLLNIMME